MGLAALWHCEPAPPGLADGSITTGPPGTAPGADPFCLFTSRFVSHHGRRLRRGRGFSARLLSLLEMQNRCLDECGKLCFSSCVGEMLEELLGPFLKRRSVCIY